MTDVPHDAKPRATFSRTLLRFGGFAVVGGAVGYLVARLDTGDRIQALGPVQAITLAAATGLLLAGVLMFALSFNRRALSRLDAGADGPATVGEAKLMRMSGAVLALSAVLAAAPLLALVVWDTVSRETAALIVAALAVGTTVHAGLNLIVWRRADEFTRRVSLEAAALAFLIFEAGFFVWAAAELLGLAPAVSAWTIWTAMFGLYLIVAVYVSLKRGLR